MNYMLPKMPRYLSLTEMREYLSKYNGYNVIDWIAIWLLEMVDERDQRIAELESVAQAVVDTKQACQYDTKLQQMAREALEKGKVNSK